MENYLIQTKNELRLRNYSPKTIESYLNCLKDYFEFLKTNFEQPNEEKIKEFLLRKQDKNYAPQTIIFRELVNFRTKIDPK